MEKLVPSLRFPGFQENWQVQPLEHIAEINPSNGSLPDSFIYIDLESVNHGILEKEQTLGKAEAPSRAQRLLKTDDILFQTVRPYQMNNLFFDRLGKYVASTGYAQLRTHEDAKYLYQYIHLKSFVDKVLERCIGSSYPSINAKDLGQIEIKIPTRSEQHKIATFLNTLDKKVLILKKKKILLEQYKKAMMQKIFNRELRFKDDEGKEFGVWEEKQLKEVLFEHKLKNADNSVSEVFSVAKHRGVVNQIEHLGRSYSAENVSNYKVAEPHDVIYTKSPTADFPFGIIKQNLTGRSGIVSPLYGVFRPDTKYLGFLLHNYFASEVNTNNYLNPIVEKGAKNTMNINNETFLDGAKLSLPVDEKEQAKIANFLSAIDEKINLVSRQIEKVERWKKGLLGEMFV